MKIVFDFGGVLFRWHPPSFLARVWPQRVADEQAGVAVAREFFQAYSGDWGAFDQGLADWDSTASRIAARTGWPRAEVEQVMAAVPDELALNPGTVALMVDLKAAGHELHYLSNMPEPYADHLERSHPLQGARAARRSPSCRSGRARRRGRPRSWSCPRRRAWA